MANLELSDFLIANPHYIVTHHFYLLRDLSGNNPENIPPLDNGEYVQFMQDVNMAVRMGPLIVSIYTDASGTNFALDTNGNPISSRTINTTNYHYPYYDANNILVEGVLTTVFDDGSSFSNDDEHNTSFWYNIQGVSDPINLQQYT